MRTVYGFIHITTALGCGRPGPGARASTKISEEILQWASTHKGLAEKVSGNGILGDLHIYPCKMLTSWYMCYD